MAERGMYLFELENQMLVEKVYVKVYPHNHFNFSKCMFILQLHSRETPEASKLYINREYYVQYLHSSNYPYIYCISVQDYDFALLEFMKVILFSRSSQC